MIKEDTVCTHTLLCIYTGFDQIPLSGGLYSIFVMVLYLCASQRCTEHRKHQRTEPNRCRGTALTHARWEFGPQTENQCHRADSKRCLFSTAKTSSQLGWKKFQLWTQICIVPQTTTSLAFQPNGFQNYLFYWHHCYFLKSGQCFPSLSGVFDCNDYLFKKQTHTLSFVWKVILAFCQPQKWSKHVTKSRQKEKNTSYFAK